MQYCTSCGAPLQPEQSTCPSCNTAQYAPISTLPVVSQDAAFNGQSAYGFSPATTPVSPLVTAPPPAPSRLLRRRRTPRSWISLALCIIVGASVGYYITSSNHATQTARLYQQATATALVLDSTAQADDPAQIYTTVTGKTPTLVDSLEDAQTSKWHTASSTNGGSCNFENGSYYVKEVAPHYFIPCYAQQSFSNFIFQVQMTIVQGDDGVMLFRASKADGKFYLLRIDQSGQYALDMYPDNSGKNVRILARTTSNWIKTGHNQLNIVAIVVRNNTFSLFINHHYVTDVVDSTSTYTQGTIALGAEDINSSGGTTVMYNNVQVWNL